MLRTHDPTIKHPVYTFEVLFANGKPTCKYSRTRLIRNVNSKEVIGELDIIRMNGTTVAVGDVPLAQLLDMRVKHEK